MFISPSGFGRGLIIALAASAVVGAAAYKLYGPTAGGSGETAEELTRTVEAALEAVRKRDLTPSSTLRVTATYDAVLAPLDKMLRLARNIAEGEKRDPAADYDRIRAFVEPVIRLTALARDQARRESGPSKDYRFMEQKGEACQLLAAALWNQLEARRRSSPAGRDGVRFVPEPADSERLYAILNDGLGADPANKALWRLRGLVERANGLFGRAESDLRMALNLDGQYAAAWNDLGLVLINLRQFDEAGESFVKAKDQAAAAAKLAGRPLGPEYGAALLNLTEFHLSLADYYRRETGIDPANRDNQDRLRFHLAGAADAARELVANLPPESPEAIEGQRLLSRITY
ncbi:MAG: hypothetical protein LBU23_10025 [Planctomycetota bacterium]|jgi:tetratricopeptide (TPR) repeat protein|nr:hypothetical protein [Planctomycetota bacterium]